LPGKELHSAGRAAGVAATGVQLIDARFIFQRQDQALVLRDFEFALTFHGELRHGFGFPGNSDLHESLYGASERSRTGLRFALVRQFHPDMSRARNASSSISLSIVGFRHFLAIPSDGSYSSSCGCTTGWASASSRRDTSPCSWRLRTAPVGIALPRQGIVFAYL